MISAADINVGFLYRKCQVLETFRVQTIHGESDVLKIKVSHTDNVTEYSNNAFGKHLKDCGTGAKLT